MLFLLTLGGWWLYLVFKLSTQLEIIDSANNHQNLIRMVQWEGVTFLILSIIITVVICYIFISDSRKSHAVQSFFASLTHELKTPLASINLQSQVLQDYIESNVKDSDLKKDLTKYTARLHSDCFKLEDELNKHLELSRIENNGLFPLEEFDIIELINNCAKKQSIKVDIKSQQDQVIVKGQISACQVIFKNLFENTQRHNKNTSVITVDINCNYENVLIRYNDNGEFFSGDLKSLGKIFYKHLSPKGSGIGLYIISKLMKKMKGQLRILNEPTLVFDLVFKKGSND